MLEAGAQQVPEEIVLEGIKFGRKNSQEVIKLIEEITKEAGQSKRTVEKAEYAAEVKELIEFIKENVDKAIVRQSPKEADKKMREERTRTEWKLKNLSDNPDYYRKAIEGHKRRLAALDQKIASHPINPRNSE